MALQKWLQDTGCINTPSQVHEDTKTCISTSPLVPPTKSRGTKAPIQKLRQCTRPCRWRQTIQSTGFGELFGCHLDIKIQCKLWNGSNWWRGWWQCWGLDGAFQPNFTKLFAEYLKFLDFLWVRIVAKTQLAAPFGHLYVTTFPGASLAFGRIQIRFSWVWLVHRFEIFWKKTTPNPTLGGPTKHRIIPTHQWQTSLV